MLGKKVEYRRTNYHKVPGIVELSISSNLVTLIGD